ncbi:[protein-PII] uridylyltransferase [Actinomadura algeriensis]|uniref:Bifunctional uridylyltransferase/uridylyl-removing enzyme n=1 Tax=Actinomadura algeriensis TaxID=1679523 RepID=A0ABR9JWI9_9ACTN|nr:[protein-PII] uridylyltransferase [Actinomadura algeriensis]MBE1534764.1 [protein-PII] uridylyltransferase [Actinomadura algeriensis]
MTVRSGNSARTALAAARAERAADIDRRLTGLLAGPPDDGPLDGALDGDRGERAVALVTVGGHARRDLTPGGDLDLVLLHRGRPDIAEIADRVWYPVWDSGIRLDHSVRTVAEARDVARTDLKAALGLLAARHVTGDPALLGELRAAVLADWRAHARTRLPELAALCRERWAAHGELAFLLEPDLKEARGGLRDVHVMRAVAASWVAPAPDGRVQDAHDLILDVRHALHDVTGRATDRLVLQEHDAVARALEFPDAHALKHATAEAARTIAHAADQLWRRVERFAAGRRAPSGRRPVGDGAVEHDGEVVLARGADLDDPALVPRVAAAAAQHGLPLAPATVERLAASAAVPRPPWPSAARDALVSLLGAGPAAIPVWEALDQAGVIVRLIPEWEHVRNRPQRDPIHRFTVDRHLVETAAGAAALTRDVARPDLLLTGALLHDIGKGRGGDHSAAGAPIARDIAARLGFADTDARVLRAVVRHHLLLPHTATRRDIDDPATIGTVTAAVADVPGRERETLELLAALAIADGNATGPAAWNAWKARLVAELARRAAAALSGGTPPPPPALGERELALARRDGVAVRVAGTRVTIAAPDRPGLLWRAAGVLALHRLAVRRARTVSSPGTSAGTAVLDFTAVPEFGSPPEPAALEADLRRMLADRLDVADRLERRARARRVRPGTPVPPPRVMVVDGASSTAAVVEVRAHDRPGLLWRIGRALGGRGLQIRAAQVDTLGAEAVDVFYVVDARDRPPADPSVLEAVRADILEALA